MALLATLPAAAIAPGPVVDYSIALLLPAHNYLGMDAIFTDYVHGDVMPKVAKGLNAGVHLATVGGLLYFNAHDIGICDALAQLWAL